MKKIVQGPTILETGDLLPDFPIEDLEVFPWNTWVSFHRKPSYRRPGSLPIESRGHINRRPGGFLIRRPKGLHNKCPGGLLTIVQEVFSI